MAKYQFNQAALLGRGAPGVIAGKLFGKGVHEVPEKLLKDPTFMHFEKHGLIEKFAPNADGAHQQQLKTPTSDIAKGAAAAAAKSQLDPDVEIGGDEKAKAKPKGK